ncbi:class I SAM-dependent methyltransferase [Heyndrickxia oleronia]|uniref:class I SAM-dependent methyltransferase n=1 Tax=Heyndrickxia oleronia TaxID=38875 RepID=UPI003F84A36B
MKFTYHDALAYYGIGGAHPGGLSLTKNIFKNERIQPSNKILDAGCGTGQTASFLAETYKCHVTALDSHPIMLKKAKLRFKQKQLPITVIKGSVENLPFPAHSYDMVISESVTAFTNIPNTLSEYYRILTIGGVLITIDMTAEIPLQQRELNVISDLYGISNVLTEEQWIHLIKTAGFKNIEILQTDSISSHIKKNIERPEYHLSESIDPHIHELILKHQQVTLQLSNKLGYRIFRSTRK